MATVFLSYSHKDEILKDQLEVQLSTLKHQGLIEAWHDRRIKAGDEFDGAISAELDRADVILLLVSPDFLASRYIRDNEMVRAMKRHEAGEARVIPVILRACDWTHASFGTLLAAPKDGRPIKSWPDIDEAFLDVVRMIRDALPAPGDPMRGSAGAARGRGLAFKITSPGQPQFIFPLPAGKTLKIGRATSNDLVIPEDRLVSRLHCLATVRGDLIYIEDAAPTNPLRINGVEKQDGEMRIRDRLELGDTVLVLIPYA